MYICIYVYMYICIYVYMYICISAVEMIWYKTQLTGCSYLVLQSRHIFPGLTTFSNAALVSNNYMLYLRRLPRSRGVPTSFYDLIMMFLTNRGTPQ